MAVQTKIIFRGTQELSRSLSRVGIAIRTASSGKIGRRLGTEGLRVVKRLTPRQRNQRNRSVENPRTARGHPPIWKQWDLIEEEVRSSAYRAVIRNKAAADKSKGGGLALLASLEFGAKPHTISARADGFLAWREQGRTTKLFAGRRDTSFADIEELTRGQRARGDVFAKQVSHPGHGSFRMVADTRRHLERTKDLVLAEFKADIERIFGQGFRITV